MNVQYLDFCVLAEGSNFAIWSSKWTPCDINVEIKKKNICTNQFWNHFSFELVLGLSWIPPWGSPWSPQPWWHPISLLLWQQAGSLYLSFILLGPTISPWSPTQGCPLLQAL